MDGLVEWINGFVSGGALQSVISAVAIIVITAVVAYFATKLIRRIMSVDGLPLPSSSIIVNIARAAIWAIGVSVALSTCFGVDVSALVAALGVGGIALSLGLQDTIKNFIGGLQVTVMGIVRPGDHIVVGTVEGLVKDVTWRQTTVKDFENNIHIIPNALINSTEITKIKPDLLVSTRLSFVNDGRALDEVVGEMERVAKHAVEAVALLEKDPWILMTEIGEYGMWAKLRFVLKEPTYAREARDAALRALAPYTRINSAEILAQHTDEE